MAYCTTCHSEYDSTLAHCPDCAEESAESFACEHCGEGYKGGDSCPSCGSLRVERACDEHPDRPAEKRCVLCGKAVCEDCRSGDSAAVCADHRTVPIIEGWAQVYSTTGEFEAQLVRENLRAEGIDAQIYSQKDSVLTVDLGELSIVRVLVPVWEYETALQTIRAHMDTEGEVVFACPACGDAYDPGTRECAACGAALV